MTETDDTFGPYPPLPTPPEEEPVKKKKQKRRVFSNEQPCTHSHVRKWLPDAAMGPNLGDPRTSSVLLPGLLEGLGPDRLAGLIRG